MVGKGGYFFEPILSKKTPSSEEFKNIPFHFKLNQLLEKMALYCAKRLVVILVSGNVIIPSTGRFLDGFLVWSHSFVSIPPSQEGTNNGFRVSTTGMYDFSTVLPTIVLNS